LKDYILRIQRRGDNDPRRLVGVAEEVGVEGNKAFSNLDELWSILNSSRAEIAKTNKPNGPNKPNKLNKPLKHRKQGEL
jgi:hypothetical protein